jgi:hypothetical protein
MSLKQPAMAIAAGVFCALLGSGSALAQEDCGRMHHRVMEAYQTRSPDYGQMLNHYNARCLSGSSARPGWERDDRNRHEYDRHEYDRRGYNDDHLRRGW